MAAATPKVAVADCVENTDRILACIREMQEEGAKIMVLPELAVTGYTPAATCSGRSGWWREAGRQLDRILEEDHGRGRPDLCGAPHGGLWKAVQCGGGAEPGEPCWGSCPKNTFPATMNFTREDISPPGQEQVEWIERNGEKVPFGMNLLFACREMPPPDRGGGDLRGPLGTRPRPVSATPWQELRCWSICPPAMK